MQEVIEADIYSFKEWQRGDKFGVATFFDYAISAPLVYPQKIDANIPQPIPIEKDPSSPSGMRFKVHETNAGTAVAGSTVKKPEDEKISLADTNMTRVNELQPPQRLFFQALAMYVDRESYEWFHKHLDHNCVLELIVGCKNMITIPVSLMNRYVINEPKWHHPVPQEYVTPIKGSYVKFVWRPLTTPFWIEQGEYFAAKLSGRNADSSGSVIIVPENKDPLRVGVALEGNLYRAVL
jgi:hypothetical protein